MGRAEEYMNVSHGHHILETMKAIVLSGVGEENLKLEEVKVPECGDNQLLARVDSAAACSSDNKLIRQGPAHPLMYGWDVSEYPVIIGHEGTVTIVKVGKNLKSKYQVGQRFAIQPAVPTGPRNYRERYRDRAKGINKIAIGYTLPGLFAEYVLITEETIETNCLVSLPDYGIPYFGAALAEPLSCVIAAQKRIVHFLKDSPFADRHPEFGPKSGGVTLIIGDGPMGLMNSDVSMTYHPKTIIVSGHHLRRINRIKKALYERCKKRGIKLVCALSGRLDEILLRETKGAGVDDVIVATGNPQAHEDALRYLARGGVAHFFGGIPFEERIIPLDTHRVHYDGISIVGSSGSDPTDVARALEMMAEGLIDPGGYVVQCGGLDATPFLIRAAGKREIEGKGVIYPHTRSALFDVKGWNLEKERNYLEENLVNL